jgi:carbamoylphosphate synthase large subunit
MAQSKIRLLLLSVGTLSAQNVLDAIGSRRERCVLLGTNSVADAAGNFRCDVAYLVPPAAAGVAYLERVSDVIRKERPDLVIPCRDDDILALAILGERSQLRAVLLTGSVAAARVMNDKVETSRFAARHGLPFAPTAATIREALEFAATHSLPLIGKPRCGNASNGVVLLRSTDEIKRAFASRPDLIAQPLLDPPSDIGALLAPCREGLPFFFSFPETRLYLIQAIIGPDGAISHLFGGLATQVMGQSIRMARCDNPDLLEVGQTYCQALADEGWKGPVNVQMKRMPKGDFVAYELNGRFTGGTAARTLLGFDEVAEVIARFLPAADFPSIPAASAELVQNYLASYTVPSAGVAALEVSGRWCSD